MLQLTAFGARDHCYVDSFRNAPRRQLKRKPFGGIHSHSIIDDSTPTESLLQMEQTCIITTALMEFL